MRWKTVLTGFALAAIVVGCKQPCFMTEADYNHYREMGLPANLECDNKASLVPASSASAAPPTVLFPERPPRYLTLQEAIASALEKGTVGSPSLNGTTNTAGASFQGTSVISAETSIRVLAYDPAIVGSNIEASLAKFDVQWQTNINYSVTDQPVGGNFVQSFQNGDHASVGTSLLKPLPTGGVAGISFITTYQDLSQPTAGIQNPAYRPTLQFQFEQPLLQGFGVEINQLRAAHPGSILTPFTTTPRVEGVLITRLRFDEQRAEFERNVNVLLCNAEVAYWNLYGSYWALYSREQALRQAFEAYKINKERFEAGRIAVQDLAQTRQQYESFRAQRIQALGTVLDSESALRALMGLPVEDGTRLIPTDKPTLAPYMPDWTTAINEALTLRPELILSRQDLKFRQLDLVNQKNLLMPDLRFFATYDLNGLGGSLTGDGFSSPDNPNNFDNALRSLASDHFNDWQIGLRMTVPLGFRDAHSAVRAARLQLARAYTFLRDQELKAHEFLRLEYCNLIENYELIRAQRAQREAAAEQLASRFKEFISGRGTLDFLLEAQRVWADALRDEFNAIVQYNNALCSFEFAKGTIMQHDNIIISEGALPQVAQVRAVEHEREKSKALVLRERSEPIPHPPIQGPGATIPGLPTLPATQSPSLPSLFEGQGTAPPLPDNLPSPRKDGTQSPAPSPEQLPTPQKGDGSSQAPMAPSSALATSTGQSPTKKADDAGAGYNPWPGLHPSGDDLKGSSNLELPGTTSAPRPPLDGIVPPASNLPVAPPAGPGM